MAHFTRFENEKHAQAFFRARNARNAARKRMKRANVMRLALLIPDHNPTPMEIKEAAQIMGCTPRSIRNYLKELEGIGKCPCCGHWTLGL